MIAKVHSLMFGADGEQYLTLSVRQDFRKNYDALKGEELDVTIKKHRNRRSSNANAYAWVLIDKLASKLYKDKEEIYKNAIRRIGGVSEIVCVKASAFEKLKQTWEAHGTGWQVEKMDSKIDGCVNAILFYGSSTFDTRQMSEFISLLIQDCEAVGIPTITFAEAEQLAQRWGNNKGEKRG